MRITLMIVDVSLLVLTVAFCFRNSQATCSYFEHCAVCPMPTLQCTTCGREETMSDDKQKCLACPTHCEPTMCRYNNSTKKTECSRCKAGYQLSNDNTTCTAVSGCYEDEAVLTESEGTFGINTTQYQNNMTCRWRLYVNTSKVIKLEFLYFDIEFGSPCSRFDFVTVYEGLNDGGTLIGEFCGSIIPTDITSNNTDLFVTFKSDQTRTKYGFNVKYTAINRVCDSNCTECVVNGAGKCDEDKCQDGYLFNELAKTCDACYLHCNRCVVNGAGKCDSKECHDGYGFDADNKTCEPCDANCDICTRNGARRCDDGNCHDRYAFDDITKTCRECPANCETCSYNPLENKTDCDRCISKFVTNSGKTCEPCAINCDSCTANGQGLCDPSSCTDGYKFFTTSRTCGVCSPHCLDCLEPGTCYPDKCESGYIFNTGGNSCLPCAANCLKCVSNGQALCDTGRCASGHTLNASSNTCTACAPNCMICNNNGPGKCDEGQCSGRYAYNPTTKSCIACPVHCDVCRYSTSLSSAECQQCDGPRGVNRRHKCSGCAERCHSCIQNGAGKCDPGECHVGYALGSDDMCIECPPNCLECYYNNQTTECTRCYGMFGLRDEDNTCQECDPNCESCATSGAGKCDPGQCRALTLYVNSSKTCKQCPDHCLQCDYNTTTDRTECSKCETTFTVTIDFKCAACKSALENCDDCTFVAHVCAKCSQSYEVKTNECVPSLTASFRPGVIWVIMNIATAYGIVYLVNRPLT